MKMQMGSRLIILFFCFATLIPEHSAFIKEFDDVWKQRALAAQRATDDAYEPQPEKVTNHLLMHVKKLMDEEGNKNNITTTKRSLMGRIPRSRRTRRDKGPCEAINPIDSCWRCRDNWADERFRLADCVLGFGRNTTGGKGGKIYVVTDNRDDDVVNPRPGTLRHAVIQMEPLWIIFAHDMCIKLTQELIIYCNKTIDARGADVHIAYGAGLTLQYVQNVILHGLHIHHIKPCSGGSVRDSVSHFGFRTASDGDGISIFGSTNIWLDHISMSQCQDGIIDVIQGSTAITISNSHFTKHNDVILLGASDGYNNDKKMQVTIAFNHFGKGLIQRMPRGRWGFFHVINNDYTNWMMYAIGGSSNPTFISQGNRFTAPDDEAAKEVTKHEVQPYHEWKHWVWKSEGDLFRNGAFFNQSGDPNAHTNIDKFNWINMHPATAVARMTRFAGALYCSKGKKC